MCLHKWVEKLRHIAFSSALFFLFCFSATTRAHQVVDNLIQYQHITCRMFSVPWTCRQSITPFTVWSDSSFFFAFQTDAVGFLSHTWHRAPARVSRMGTISVRTSTIAHVVSKSSLCMYDTMSVDGRCSLKHFALIFNTYEDREIPQINLRLVNCIRLVS